MWEEESANRSLRYWNYQDTLSIKNGLLTSGSRIIVPHEMWAEMLQYIHEGHQGRERYLLRARNTVFWPRISYDIQELIERCIICQEHGKSQPIIGITQDIPPFPWHTLATDIFYWKRMDFLIVADVFSKYFLVRKLTNSSSAAVCAEIATIVTELGLPHVIRSDNGPCYNSKEFQQMLQWYNITHQTSSPHHPWSNGFVERMVGVAKKLMDKAGSEGKLWISGLYEYRVTPHPGSIASPLQLITQHTPREKDLPQLPSTLGAQEMYDTHQEILKRQPVQPERSYIELTPGTAIWVQHKQNTSWEPAIVASQSSSNSYWIMQENSDDQPKVYRWTRSILKIRCTDVWNPTTEYSHSTENQKAKFHSPYILNEERNRVWYNSVNEIPSDLVIQTKSNTASVSDSVFSERKEENAEIAEIVEDAPAEEPAPVPVPAPALHWKQSKSDHTLQEQGSQHARTLGNQPVHIVTFTCETLSRPGSVDTQYNVELYEKLVNKLFRLFCTMDTHICRVVKSIVTPFRTINLRIQYLNFNSKFVAVNFVIYCDRSYREQWIL